MQEWGSGAQETTRTPALHGRSVTVPYHSQRERAGSRYSKAAPRGLPHSPQAGHDRCACLPLTEIHVIWLKRKNTRLIFRFPGCERRVERERRVETDLTYPMLQDGFVEGGHAHVNPRACVCAQTHEEAVLPVCPLSLYTYICTHMQC